MLGDFQYCSSSSDDSSSDGDSDSSSKSDCGLDKLYAEKQKLNEKIRAFEEQLKTIHGTLKTLNEERNKLLLLRNKLISSCFNDENPRHDNGVSSIDLEKQSEHDGSFAGTTDKHVTNYTPESQDTNHEPLNLEVPTFSRNNDDEEFDSD